MRITLIRRITRKKNNLFAKLDKIRISLAGFGHAELKVGPTAISLPFLFPSLHPAPMRMPSLTLNL